MSLERLMNKYQGKRCFIVATGPSLAYKNMSFLEDEFTIGVNFSPIMFDLWGFQPDFNIVADKYVFPHYKKELLKLIKDTNTIKIAVASACDTYPEELKDKNTFFVPKKLPQDIVSFSTNPVQQGFSRGKTVTYDAVQLANFLGFNEVYILGMDMSTNHEWGVNGHCYELQQNPKFSDLNFFGTDSHVIQRGLPGNSNYREFIETLMTYARTIFEEQGKRLFIEESSQLKNLPKINIFRDFANMPNVAAVVPAKGTSSRVPGKNIKLLGDKPLYLHIVDTLLSCATIDNVYLDTESEEVKTLLGDRPVYWIKRDPKLASNATDGNTLLLYEASQITDADIIVQALPTGPFLSRKSIDETVYSLVKDRALESTFTVLKSRNYTWNHNGTPNYNIDKIPNSVDLQSTIIEAMNLYAIRREALLSLKRRIGNKFHMQEISEIEATDIDTPEDFMIAEAIYQKINEGQKYEKR